MAKQTSHAPGWPGIPPRWTSSAKSGVGAALNAKSRVWFTLSHGIVNEVYYSRVDQACIRDLGLIVTDDRGFFSEEKRQTQSSVAYLAKGVPAYRMVNTCHEGRYKVEKVVYSDPMRDVLLQEITFTALEGTLTDYHLYALLAPHLGNRGWGNNAWIGDYKGHKMLFAEGYDNGLALASSAPWLQRSAGFVGVSDGWQDLHEHKQMTWNYERAENGNVALTGEIDLAACDGQFVLALGFGQSTPEAGLRAVASLLAGPEQTKTSFVHEWQTWQKRLAPIDVPFGIDGAEDDSSGESDGEHLGRLFHTSAAVLRSHEAKRFPGGVIASMSIPWGSSKGDDDLGGYHIVWPRDLVEAAGGFFAAGAKEDARRILYYLQSTQAADGHWPQNMWLDGTPYWTGIQMDETALPILLVELARREDAIDEEQASRLWPMVRLAARYLVQNGPVTQQDRWEEDPGYSPFTLAVEIAALLVAADLAEHEGEPEIAGYMRETADSWNASIERWTYATETELSQKLAIDGYYVRISPVDRAEAGSPIIGFVPIKNRPPGEDSGEASSIVSPDALALVRFGLRAADDPRIVNTVRAIDALLRVETEFGPSWRRYDGDGYGEHKNGAPFDGAGIGRLWPLLTGERGHYELAAGKRDNAVELLGAMEAFSNGSGLLPEQVWDDDDIPALELFHGRPSGSAMPLVWAHAEYLKLLRSIQDGRVFDTPTQTLTRYIQEKPECPYTIWRFNNKRRTMKTGTRLRVELVEPATIHWTGDDWKSAHDIDTHDTGLGMHIADLETEPLSSQKNVVFTLYWSQRGEWDGTNYRVEVTDGE